MTLLLRETNVLALLTMESAIGLMESALRAHSTGDVVQPVRLTVSAERHLGFLALMPAYVTSSEAFGAKAVTFYPGNVKRGLPTHMAMVLLWDSATGELLAIIDGRLITEMRTAAVSAAATKALARPEAGVLAILGAGVQARSHLEALRLVRSIREVRVWSRTAEHAGAFAREAARMGVDARAVPSAEAAVRGADLICTVTSATEPVLRGEWIAPGAHINAVGAPRPTWRELDTAAVARARVFVDSRAGALAESGDLLLPLQEGAIDAAHIVGEIGEVFAGMVPGRTGADDVTLFKSLGMAVEDVVTAQYVYQRAREKGVGQEIAL
ncbi:MAG TPA: ornithine cyclodeaminase family protein [bacterium]|jgi:ornithine cyclodeaminase|nr:ornithine cyclodeaminase family protein [bacterium]